MSNSAFPLVGNVVQGTAAPSASFILSDPGVAQKYWTLIQYEIRLGDNDQPFIDFKFMDELLNIANWKEVLNRTTVLTQKEWDVFCERVDSCSVYDVYPNWDELKNL